MFRSAESSHVYRAFSCVLSVAYTAFLPGRDLCSHCNRVPKAFLHSAGHANSAAGDGTLSNETPGYLQQLRLRSSGPGAGDGVVLCVGVGQGLQAVLE